MGHKVTISRTTLTVNGLRAGIWIDTGPWVATVPPEQVVIRSKRSRFPAGFHTVFAVTNESDPRTDYHEADRIKLTPEHPFYSAARAAAA